MYVLRSIHTLALAVVLVPACGTEAEDAGDSTGDVDGSGSGGDLPPLPPPIAQACGTGEVPNDLLCVQACPADVDQIVAGLQVECDVTEIRSATDGATLEIDLPPCEPDGAVPAGKDACYVVNLDDGLGGDCFEDGWQVQIEVVRVEGSDTGCRIEPRCQLSSHVAIDCPDSPTPSSVCGDGSCVIGEGCSDCPEDCGACGDYTSCDAEADCSLPTPHCATSSVFDNGGGICTVGCNDAHPCPESVETGDRARCLNGMCLPRCESDDDCGVGTSCVDLGPIQPGGNVLACVP